MDSSPIICFGAGNLGRRIARVVHPVLFCDNNSSLWQTNVDGIPVESPKAAVELYPDAIFVVAIWNPSPTETMLDRLSHLRSLGASTVIPFSTLLAEYGDVLAPHMLWERPSYYAVHQADIARARALFDEEGRREFDRQMRLRSGDFSGQVIDPGIQYFPEDLFRLSQTETFVDCGAYDGDTIAEFRKATGDCFSHIIAFEPDPGNFTALQSAVDGDRRITLQPYATGARRETLRFAVGAGVASRVSSTGTCAVEAIALDEALNGIAPTFMKFDIEGSEAEALEGAGQTIARHRPKMAVCLYHLPDHLWSIPLRLNELLPNSHFSMRTYASDGFECVCYCVPQ
ncbi:MAG TPA: FkbM family methyltransferase [Candidatus Sulfotelmatobacter sp.]|nr:FkbM family methyltransferase [Candidatus Sulfotelmatobacter sp.]